MAIKKRNFANELSAEERERCKRLAAARKKTELVFGPEHMVKLASGALQKKAKKGKSVVVRVQCDDFTVVFTEAVPNTSRLDAARVFPRTLGDGKCLVCRGADASVLVDKCAHLCFCESEDCFSSFAKNHKCPHCDGVGVCVVRVM